MIALELSALRALPLLLLAGACSAADAPDLMDPTTVTAVEVTPHASTVTRGSSRQFTAVAVDDAGAQLSGVRFTWASSDDRVATVDQNGLVRGVSSGTAVVSATAGGRTGQASVYVEAERVLQWRANEPAGFRSVSDHPWNTLDGVDGAVRPNGWGYMNWNQGGSAYLVNDPGDPASTGSAVEVMFPQGLRSGYSPATLSYDAIRTSELYYAFTVWHEPTWVEQDPATKFVHLMFSSGNMHLDRFTPNPTWGGTYDAVAGQWAVMPTGWSLPRDFNNMNPAAARARYGEWQMVELYVRMGSGNGIVRLWVDGVLTAEHRNLTMPSTTINTVQHGNTYGGGMYPVPQNQRLRIGHSYISVP